jgi:hypothetical protein
MAANGLNVVAVRIEDKCPVVVRVIVGPKPWLAVVAPARADSRCVKAVDGSAIPILNTSYNPASFSYWVAQVVRPFVVSSPSVTEQEATPARRGIGPLPSAFSP